ncbi:MAG: hypothetical protein JNK04_11195 [Myxococcales bacterium]|nr:hypothetical protein [Myxococcales bacterium]
MSDIELRIDALSFDDFEGDAESVRAGVEKMLSLVATRLAKSPVGKLPSKRIALAELELGTFSAKELGAPGGAERLADALYASLERNLV